MKRELKRELMIADIRSKFELLTHVNQRHHAYRYDARNDMSSNVYRQVHHCITILAACSFGTKDMTCYVLMP